MSSKDRPSQSSAGNLVALMKDFGFTRIHSWSLSILLSKNWLRHWGRNNLGLCKGKWASQDCLRKSCYSQTVRACRDSELCRVSPTLLQLIAMDFPQASVWVSKCLVEASDGFPHVVRFLVMAGVIRFARRCQSESAWRRFCILAPTLEAGHSSCRRGW